ncbi:putative RNA-directed DNA polymerase [Helianthus annuus]|nr:putative RNA-directed DNA polymerase [Helianthus annuus]KAJ0595532.1 putative RNA-directed DNA polymerase [Helianthus annuus]
MSEFQVIGGVKKLNNTNYNTWATCIKSYLQGQDLWNIVNGNDTRAPTNDINGALGKWQVKSGKAMFVIKTTIEEELLDHIQELEYPKQAWDTLAQLFSKKNDARLQLLESELMGLSQGEMSIQQFFRKVKNLCREIGELDQQSKVGEARMRRIIIHGLRAEYRGFITAIQGWPTQPTITEFENLLTGQEAQARQLAGGTFKQETEALYASKGREKSWKNKGNNRDKGKKSYESDKKKHTDKEDKPNDKKQGKGKRFPFRCYNCGVKGHMARDCKEPKREEGNSATIEDEQPWDPEAYVAQVEEVQALTVTVEPKSNKLDDWIVDSGCSNHLTGEKDRLSNIRRYEGNRVVVIADNSRHQISNIGDVKFTSPNSNEGLQFENVYHVPGMKKNLISVPQITETGKYVVFGPHDVQIFEEFETKSVPILQGRKKDTVYVLSAESAFVERTQENKNSDLWHARLGHVAYDKLELMSNKRVVNGLPKMKVTNEVVCAGCQYGKSHQLPFERSKQKTYGPLELVHTDVFGPVKHKSLGGKEYMITFIDDYSRFVWVAFMKAKSEALNKFKEFKKEAERMTNTKIKVLRSDNGGEYTSQEFNEFLKECKITRQLTCPNTPQQNGVAERKNRHLAEVCGSIMHAKNVPGRFWADAMSVASYVINRLPQQQLNYATPHELLLKIKPNVSYFRIFGCVCYVFVPSHLRVKLEKKAVRCIFVGYDQERKGWKCCDPTNGKCYISRNVIFDENLSWWSSSKETLPDSDSEKLKEELETFVVKLNLDDSFEELTEAEDEAVACEPEPTAEISDQGQSSTPLRRSSRASKPNPRYAHVVSIEEEVKEPETYIEASTKPEWIKAMKQELDALKNNETWELVPKPEGVKTVSCKWVFKLKKNTDGTIQRYKARLVARGFTQEYGLDYDETFSPVAKLTTVRVLIALATSLNWKLDQMDVNNAFLYGDLSHTVYMDQPIGFEEKKNQGYVCKLKKALYGLKQSPRAWYGKMGEFLSHNGYESSSSDASLFVKREGAYVAIVLVYVDDLIISGNWNEEIGMLKENLCTRFRIKDLGRLKHFLGLEVSYLDDGVILHQTKVEGLNWKL